MELQASLSKQPAKQGSEFVLEDDSCIVLTDGAVSELRFQNA
jgi:hypothetical protein